MLTLALAFFLGISIMLNIHAYKAHKQHHKDIMDLRIILAQTKMDLAAMVRPVNTEDDDYPMGRKHFSSNSTNKATSDDRFSS